MRLTAEDLVLRFKRLGSDDDIISVADVLAFCTALMVQTLRDAGWSNHPKQVKTLLRCMERQIHESLTKDTIH